MTAEPRTEIDAEKRPTRRADGSSGWYMDMPLLDSGSPEGQAITRALALINRIYAHYGAEMGLVVMQWIDRTER